MFRARTNSKSREEDSVIQVMMTIIRPWRQRVSASLSKILAILSVATTLLLFIHTNQLQYQLKHVTGDLEDSVYLRRSALEYDQRERSSANYILNTNISRYKVYNPSDYSKLDPASLNITGKYKKLTLMFNRVPKVGSQSTMELLRVLSYKNGYTFHKDRPQKTESIKLSIREQKRLTELVDLFRPPSVYVKHVCYINFTIFNVAQPIYINMVRDPVERAISWYYYVRAPWYFVERKRAFPELPLPSSEWLRKDYETCVRKRDNECQYIEGRETVDFSQLTEFFCGQDKECTGFNSDYALQKAKENVEQNYAVVGVLEDMNITLTVLEHYLPRFFKGAKTLYWEQKKFSNVNKNIYKPSVTDEVKNIVRKNFTREIEFYEFCRQRLYKQYGALNLS